jgi:hypothetical protein
MISERNRHLFEYLFMFWMACVTLYGLYRTQTHVDEVREYGRYFEETCEERSQAREAYRLVLASVASSAIMSTFNVALPPIECEVP